MAGKFIGFIDSTLNTRITPLAYLIAIHSFILGASFVFFGWESSVQASLLYQNGALFGAPIWGLLTMISTGVLIVGMFLKDASLTKLGAMGAFASWIFAAITYAQGELWLQMILALVLMLCFGYHFLASSLGRLWDYRP